MKQIGNYTYNEKYCLGQGAFGKVYEGTSRAGKRVAIKRIDKQIIDTDNYMRSSIQGEIQILKKFNHPNIVHLEDMVLTTNNIYIVTQFCKDGDLKQYLRVKKPSQQEALQILSQILNGFREIEKLEIIHRDLKPANILISDNVFKICDFGFAKYSKQMQKMNKTCVGTPMYMSPQVLKGKPYTNKTDIWSLGILTYEMMFARTPWQGTTQESLYKNIIEKGLQIPHCSSFTYELLKGMLEVEEEKRWDWRKIFEYTKLAEKGELENREEKREKEAPKWEQNIEPVNFSLPKGKSPRFLYYILIELHLNSLDTNSFKLLKSCLFAITTTMYSQLLDTKQDRGIIGKEFEILKNLQIERPSGVPSIQQLKALCMPVLKQLQKHPNHPSKPIVEQIFQL